ncbi:glycosyltransferase family 4 protein [Lutibacter sp.]|uniref:glycosyltransferase family 4 protein n=1 Tax=Lutibacter sp. TaxID=1925666 RepID=UPI001A2C46B1|nr:glycosyltransferase family 4 protein [Lutibacter sp.]MBI9041323.1 glycosyltransferase family 4 protein [Lutibacter sp.]
MKPSVLFITKVCFLDAALEYIKEVKDYVDLHVLIEIDPHSKNTNILNVKRLVKDATFLNAKQLLSSQDYKGFIEYIEGCESFQFFVHHHPKSISFSSINKSFVLLKQIKKLKPDFIHFDDVSVRLVALSFLLNFNKEKLIMNVHDPVQHSGEIIIKNLFARKMFYRKVHKYVVFSKFSKSIFLEKYGYKKSCMALNLKPYNFYTNYGQSSPSKIYITFIGRISEYKGVDIFLDAINILNVKYPEVKYIIAGSPNNDLLAKNLIEKYTFENVKYIFDHLSNSKLCEIINLSQLIVCPYRDATQSGVIMTALALCAPIIVSNQGGLHEYVESGITGMISKPDAESFATAIETFIIDKIKHKQFSENIRNMDSSQFNFGKERILELYK